VVLEDPPGAAELGHLVGGCESDVIHVVVPVHRELDPELRVPRDHVGVALDRGSRDGKRCAAVESVHDVEHRAEAAFHALRADPVPSPDRSRATCEVRRALTLRSNGDRLHNRPAHRVPRFVTGTF